ncbi:PREDICTED: uncharacterized protein LOC106784076 isoform X3 [Polistes canadensis]|uniref:uncharacterized protein LOC106784076 isoform X3 n=1 Tax=Polistes canadensis TaxID=91411 RepID=UPI000718E233|nr:PREDICTED: uncharacterized protein LOC106784076 isoform X3 [Polistes canadensis]
MDRWRLTRSPPAAWRHCRRHGNSAAQSELGFTQSTTVSHETSISAFKVCTEITSSSLSHPRRLHHYHHHHHRVFFFFFLSSSSSTNGESSTSRQSQHERYVSVRALRFRGNV